MTFIYNQDSELAELAGQPHSILHSVGFARVKATFYYYHYHFCTYFS